MKDRKKILPQMFDVRPVNESGDLDLEKIGKMQKVVTLSQGENEIESPVKIETLEKKETQLKKSYLENDWVGIGSHEYAPEKKAEKAREEFLNFESDDYQKDNYIKNKPTEKKKFSEFILENIRPESGTKRKKRIMFFLKFGVAFLVVAVISNFVIRGFEIKRDGLKNSQVAMAEILAAKDSIKKGDFEKAYVQFNGANEKLDQLSIQFNGMGRILVDVTKYVPYLSKISSGSHVISAGDDLSKIGVIVSGVLRNMEAIKSGDNQGSSISYLSLLRDKENNLQQIVELLASAQKNLADVNLDDVPENDRNQFLEIKQMLPEVDKTANAFLGQEKILNDILGGNGPRKYLFLFQNNQEMRATGGFIGSYGLLDIFNGRVRKFFIDGVFNPDGQLRTRIVPPAPIQKISANWSLHDSNWFPDFPTSAEKAAWFYEKSGGPTVDGVITMTPSVMQKFLELTGPIEMPEYGITVDSNNFIQEIQYQVEVDYDKELNNPKKILGDLAPKILDKILNMKSLTDMSAALNVMATSLSEKQILIYSKNSDIEKVLSDNGWSGEVLDTPKDYLSVINTNVSGYKTDGVVDEKISHKAEIQADGSIIDTLTIVRHHNGGDTPYEWWNKVNADYMRVYVPQGAQLISAEGQTREVDAPPIDYKSLGYARDPQVQAEEDNARIDSESGTKIYDDGDKTVFANWVYVSPKETVTVKYTYLLPFKLEIDSLHISDTYSLLTQKQSGSLGSGFSSEIDYPSFYKILWQEPTSGVDRIDNLPNSNAGLKMETDLKMDKFFGIAFSK